MSHHDTPLTARESLCWHASDIESHMLKLVNSGVVESVVLLVTCNRTACIALCHDQSQLQLWWSKQLTQQEQYTTRHTQEKALGYLLRMACGLESMLVGEPHILGQLRQAFLTATRLGCCRGEMTFLLEQILCHAKQIRHESQFGRSDISLAQLAYQHVEKTFSPDVSLRVVFIGSGKIIQQHLRVFAQNPFYRLSMVCRDQEKCAPLASVYDLDLYSYSTLDQACLHADVVIAATASRGLLWTPKQDMQRLRLCIDWSVPRNIGQNSSLQSIDWVGIDDVKTLREQTHNQYHLDSIQRAKAKVLRAQFRCVEQMQIRAAGRVLARFRNQVETTHQQYLEKALKSLESGGEPSEVLRAALADLHSALSQFFEDFLGSGSVFERKNDLCQVVEKKALSALNHGKDPVDIVQRALYQVASKLSHGPTQYLRGQKAGHLPLPV